MTDREPSDLGGYPRSENLRNGLAVTIRPLCGEDREKIAVAVRELDRDSIYTRLFAFRSELTEAGLDRIMTVDPVRDVMLVVTVGAGAQETIIASGRFIAAPGDDAPQSGEVAFVVEEDYQGLGIAGRLLQHLTDIARARGVATFDADVLAKNKAMLAVFTGSGLPMRQRREGDTVHVSLSVDGLKA